MPPKNKNLVSQQRREYSRGTTLIPRTRHLRLAGHSLDDNHHPVLITENNFGLLTQFSARGSEMIFNLFYWPALTRSAGFSDNFHRFTRSLHSLYSDGLCHNSI